MYGRNITLSNGEQTISVYVFGRPDMTALEWEEGAKAIINNTMSINFE